MKNGWISSLIAISGLTGLCACRSNDRGLEKSAEQPPIAAAPTMQTAAAASPIAQTPPQSAAIVVPSNPGAETEVCLGPFAVESGSYTTVLRKRLPPGAKPGEALTVVSMEIRDAQGAAQFSRAFANTSQTEGFVDTVSVSVNPLSGDHGSGLLVSYDMDSEPSVPEPESSGWWQVLGVIDGKLKPFSGPVLVQGDLWPSEPAEKAAAPGGPIVAKGDVLQFKVWAGRFRLIFPVRIDWAQGRLAPARNCSANTCDYDVAPEKDRYAPEVTFVRLCSSPEQSCDQPERVVVKKESKVELVAARANVQWSPGSLAGWSGDPKNALNDAGGISVHSQELWLKVRIDGKEGWIHSQEDFDALGMPSEQ